MHAKIEIEAKRCKKKSLQLFTTIINPTEILTIKEKSQRINVIIPISSQTIFIKAFCIKSLAR